MARLRGDWAAGAAAWVIVLGFVCGSVPGREVKLEIRPQKVSTKAGQYVLLLPAGEAPNLYAALAVLPQPFGDVEKVIESEKRNIPSEPPAGMTRAQFESELKRSAESQNRVRVLGKRLDTDVAALQCVEAIRSHAASHGGQLPQTLAEITEVSVPKDPMSGAAFRYTRTGATAVLESATPAGGNAKDVTRYEITVKR